VLPEPGMHRTRRTLRVAIRRRLYEVKASEIIRITLCRSLKFQRRVVPQKLGDCYTFVAIERHCKLVLQMSMGKRDRLQRTFSQRGCVTLRRIGPSNSRAMDS
jgi:hypothetical protein